MEGKICCELRTLITNKFTKYLHTVSDDETLKILG